MLATPNSIPPVRTAPNDCPLWMVTSYFNPSKYKRRYQNFQVFRKLLNAPLLVVELERNGDFQLVQDDGDIVIQITGEDRIWQKERLLNVGFENLPAHVEYVGWIDCDVIFQNPDWVSKAIGAFDKDINILQPFQTISHLNSSWTPRSNGWSAPDAKQTFLDEISFCSWLAHETFCHERMIGQRETGINVAPGVAWIARRSLVAQLPIYDATVIGGGDRALTYAMIGKAHELQNSIHVSQASGTKSPWLTHSHAAHYLEWAERFDALVEKKFTYLQQRLFHQWHGDLSKRSYMKRYANLTSNGFDPRRDLRLSDSGAWQWCQPDSALAQDVAAYFDTRREDG